MTIEGREGKGEIKTGDLELRITSVKSTVANILYQNEPNPFKGRTTIAFELALLN